MSVDRDLLKVVASINDLAALAARFCEVRKLWKIIIRFFLRNSFL